MSFLVSIRLSKLSNAGASRYTIAKPPKPKPDPFSRPKRAVEIEAALKEVTGSEVHVEYKDGKGSLKIDFYSDEMLQKFADLLGHYDPEAE